MFRPRRDEDVSFVSLFVCFICLFVFYSQVWFGRLCEFGYHLLPLINGFFDVWYVLFFCFLILNFWINNNYPLLQSHQFNIHFVFVRIRFTVVVCQSSVDTSIMTLEPQTKNYEIQRNSTQTTKHKQQIEWVINWRFKFMRDVFLLAKTHQVLLIVVQICCTLFFNLNNKNTIKILELEVDSARFLAVWDADDDSYLFSVHKSNLRVWSLKVFLHDRFHFCLLLFSARGFFLKKYNFTINSKTCSLWIDCDFEIYVQLWRCCCGEM